GQNKLLALNFIHMRGLSRRIIGAENLIIVRRDGANVLFTNLLNLALAVGSPQVEGLGLLIVLNFTVGALEDYCELAKFRVSRVTGLFRVVGARARLGLIDLIIADLNLDYFVADLLKF